MVSTMLSWRSKMSLTLFLISLPDTKLTITSAKMARQATWLEETILKTSAFGFTQPENKQQKDIVFKYILLLRGQNMFFAVCLPFSFLYSNRIHFKNKSSLKLIKFSWHTWRCCNLFGRWVLLGFCLEACVVLYTRIELERCACAESDASAKCQTIVWRIYENKSMIYGGPWEPAPYAAAMLLSHKPLSSVRQSENHHTRTE